MEVLNMVPVFPIMGLLMGLLGRFLLAIGLYYLGRSMWTHLRRRY